jgi:uncharacterized 2Fe-2S/4Fe-4S cluster protein (DUF4445 family)
MLVSDVNFYPYFMKDKVTITLQPLGKEIIVNTGTPLIDILNEYGVEFPCGGKGTCGRCKVKLLAGELNPGAEQLEKLKKLGLGSEWRLACYCAADSDITLEVSEFENIILADNTNFDFIPRDGYGIAVDVGTTTVVIQLVNLYNGNIADSFSFLNKQAKFGADLISRIQACLDGRQDEMKNIIRGDTGKVIDDMLKKNRVDISKVVLVGNTVMHHIFSGLNVQPLSFYPFESPDLGIQNFSPTALNWNLQEETQILFYPSIGSFVGSDILAGIASTKIAERDKYTVLIDLGTNGEIVAGNRNGIICASTAAGPAFEGAKISQGMRAATGAISSVDWVNGILKCHVIGKAKASGICGSGLIDAIAVLLKQDKIGIFGEFNNGEDSFELCREVSLTQQDIREFQLAKAAVATGLQILMNRLGITLKDVDKVFIAGGFGNFLNVSNVIKTGLIETSEDKIVKFGNTALIGAKLFLFGDESDIQRILDITEHVNLEGDPQFQDIYIEKMMLQWNDEITGNSQ